MAVFKSPFPDVVIPDREDLYGFLLDRADRPRGRHGDDGRAGLRPDRRTWQPTKPALIEGETGETITYEELKRYADQLGYQLSTQLGLRQNDVVAILTPNHLEYAVIILGALRIGVAVTTINPTYTAEEVEYQLKDSGAQVLFTLPDLMRVAEAGAAKTKVRRIFCLGATGTPTAPPVRTLYRQPAPVYPRPHVSPKSETAIICYSSGTTGRSKGVELSHFNMIANIVQTSTRDRLYTNSFDIWHAVLPMYEFHVYALAMVLLAGFHWGVTVIVQTRFELVQYLEIVQKYKVSWGHLVPPIVLALAKQPAVDNYDLRSLRVILCGAAPLGPGTEDLVRRRLPGAIMKQGYGMTELSPSAISTPSDARFVRRGSVGLLLPNSTAKIVDPDTGRVLGAGEEGELWIKGPNVMKGYLNNAKATAETIDADGYLHTGDIARVDAEGFFYITDRLKELIKYKGFQVAPAELEEHLLNHPSVADAAVVSVPDEDAGELPKALVVLKAGVAATPALAQEIVDFVAGRVGPHKRLRGGLDFVATIPKSSSGKILRRLIRQPPAAAQAKL